ncbi:MAG: type II secretion system F family protein [Betaproteobacteria bacterium]|nr:MAG: type II secretion system F family protein [Betaproteobacteria bacterium]
MYFEVRTFSPDHGVRVVVWEAAGEADIHARAVREGLDVIELRPQSKSGSILFRKKSGFPSQQFSQEMLALAEAGFGLVEALETLKAKEKNEAYCNVVEGILSRLQAGDSFSHALAAFPEQFPPLFLESIRASEQTGDVARTLRRYVDYEEQLDVLRNHVVAASVYPALLVVSGFLVVMFMLMYVVPRLAGAYENVRGQTPALSRLLFAWGELVNAHGWLVAACAGIFIALIVHFAFDISARGRLLSWVKRIPILGEQIRIYHLARLYRTLGMLLSGGTSLVRALAMARGILPADLQPALDGARHGISQGQPLSVAFEEAGLSTIVASRMFRVGERSGDLGGIMERIATFHDERLAQWIKRFVKVFEPALMALIGVVIGAIVLLMYMPIFELAGSVG